MYQIKAIAVLAKQPNAIISSTFTKTVLVSNYFFRIRCEAAQALVTVSRRLLYPDGFPVYISFSVLSNVSTGSASSTCSSSSSGTATNPRTRTRICSVIRMYQDRTISATSRSTSFARFVVCTVRL